MNNNDRKAILMLLFFILDTAARSVDRDSGLVS